jgi:heptosyltransferase-1
MKILLVKLSSLGDVVHTLPVVQDILAAMPDAQIDWVVEKSFAPLLTQVKGIHRLIPCELRRWRKSFWATQTRGEWRAFKADLQAQSYDAVIDLQGLAKSAVVARLAKLTPQGKRFAMANQTEGSGYEAPTRWVADVAIAIEPHVHAVQRGRFLAARALGYRMSKEADFDLFYASERSFGQSIRAQAAPEKIAKKIAFIHGSSRHDKTWPLQNWVALGLRLAASNCQVTLVHGNAAELATSQAIAAKLPGSVVLPLLALSVLTQELGQCAGAIGVDSGVSHIAVALGLPHVQIYNFDTAWRTGPLGCAHQVSVFAQPHPTVDAVWQAWLACETGLESSAR